MATACTHSIKKEVSTYQVGEGASLVVLLGGSEGGYPHVPHLVKRLVENDFSVAEIAYFGLPEGPKHLSEINVDAVSAEIQALGESYSCVGVLGASKGAELALVLASYKSVSDATVAVTAPHVVWQSSKISLLKASSWTIDGEPMPFVPYDTYSLAAVSAALDVRKALNLHMRSLEKALPYKAAIIPIENATQPVLIQAALHDQVWPSTDMANAIMDRVNRLNPANGFTLKAYDHNHFLLSNSDVVDDLISFFKEELVDCGNPQ